MDVLLLSINSCAFICNAFKAYLAGVIQEQNISDSSGYIASNPVMCPQTDNFVARFFQGEACSVAVVVKTLLKNHSIAMSTYAGFHGRLVYRKFCTKE